MASNVDITSTPEDVVLLVPGEPRKINPETLKMEVLFVVKFRGGVFSRDICPIFVLGVSPLLAPTQTEHGTNRAARTQILTESLCSQESLFYSTGSSVKNRVSHRKESLTSQRAYQRDSSRHPQVSRAWLLLLPKEDAPWVTAEAGQT